MSEQKKTLEIAKEFLGKNVHVVFDRPLGSKHPKHGFIYEVNYGYIPGIMAADGEELDVYFLGIEDALEQTDGTVIAIIHREDDDDDKLVVVPHGIEIDDEAIMQAVAFQEQYFKSSVIRK
ncbi:TPA: inorganic pyrophosphatase [Candidatus Wolfebacteria bacterium]|nr:inorganic pyrophosphatase [Candidatus Wolfebacteria bacterium]HAS95278.1 inorganic pyrophosphatase [Candidatus Wolfebacteria bacterium]HBD17734.1 inorganic pyrophosphatase [Candidatus Wolfebacteria bacterium]HBN87305.1 inorganic pyrophosphatase [Candidatus Wolfebacteria bacterium]HBT74504.1 inorganic pyrophosphatase [Candidatus Wolfebacteria bacterium]